jgi:HEAT repeat protein
LDMRRVFFLLLIFLSAGCTADPVYNGKPLYYWKQELRSRDSTARWRAASTFATVGAKARIAIPELTACLDDDDYHVLLSSAAALGNTGPEASEAVPELIKLLKHPERRVRAAVEQALKKIDPEAAARAGVK